MAIDPDRQAADTDPTRCPRCRASELNGRYCPTCGLDLAPDRPSLPTGEAFEAARRSQAWLSEHPEHASIRYEGLPLIAAQLPTSVPEHPPQLGRAKDKATEELRYWHQRARFLAHLTDEARSKLAAAERKCVAAGFTTAELATLARELGPLPGAPGPRRGAGARPNPAAAGGFFAFGYYESGPDLDADGDVDGGLADTVGGFFSDLF
jgi:hypothetical protein